MHQTKCTQLACAAPEDIMMTPRAAVRTKLAACRRTLSLCVLAIALAGALTSVAVDRAEAADDIWLCSVPANHTYDSYLWDNTCAAGTSAGAPMYHVRTPADDMWACSVPAGFTWDQTRSPRDPYNPCSDSGKYYTMYHLRSLNPTPTPTTPTTVRDRMVDNAELSVNKFLQSDNARYRLSMQGDGNLVLSYRPNGHAVWDSKTAGRPASHLAMQGDGNLVIYSTTPGQAIWWTGTQGHPHATLIVQNDGNVVIYDARGSSLWSTGTRGKT
jgi:hypothetical protein